MVNLNPEKGYCVICGSEMHFNPDHPFCYLCGGPCSVLNRFSSDGPSILYCHKCGALEYPDPASFLCNGCKK